MNKKKYIVPNVVVRTRRLLVSPIMQSGGNYRMKSTSGFFSNGDSSGPTFGSGGFNIADGDTNGSSFGTIGDFGHGLWN